MLAVQYLSGTKLYRNVESNFTADGREGKAEVKYHDFVPLVYSPGDLYHAV